MKLLDPAQVALLTDEEQEMYLAALEREAAEWTLLPVQARAERESHEVDHLLYGGAAGGGKTEWMLWHIYHECIRHPRVRWLALRRTFPELRSSLIERSLEKFPTDTCRWMAADKEWRFNNGSKLVFGYSDSEDDVRQYLSAEYDGIAFEELTEFTARQFQLVTSRNRTTAVKRRRGIRPHVIAATNPGQVGHKWVKDYFITATDYGKKIAEVEVKVDGHAHTVKVAFVPAKLSDNPHMDSMYRFNLARLDETQRRQYLDGDWDVFEGQFFTEFDRGIHVIRPFDLPESWARIRAVDYGQAAPFCCLWMAVDPDGDVFVYREAYGPGNTASQQAKIVAERSRYPDERPEHYKMSVADPSVFAKGGNGVSIAAMYAENGLYVTKALNARRDGWSRVRDFLGGRDHPRVRIFDTCPNLIRTLPDMIHDKNDPEDLDTDLEDHACDALRYGLMTRPRRPKRPKREHRDSEAVPYDRDVTAAVKSHKRREEHTAPGL